MLAVCPKLRQVVFSQPCETIDGFQSQRAFYLSPQTSPFVSLMDQLEASGLEHVQGGSEVSLVDQQARATFSDPFIVQGRYRCEPLCALFQSFPPERGKRSIAFDHNLWVKSDCFGFDRAEALRR